MGLNLEEPLSLSGYITERSQVWPYRNRTESLGVNGRKTVLQ